MPGMAHGFFVVREKGPRMVGHGGNTGDFHSNMVLAPQLKLGFFISHTGGQGSYGGRTELTEALIRRGYSDDNITGVLGGNFRRLLEATWT